MTALPRFSARIALAPLALLLAAACATAPAAPDAPTPASLELAPLAALDGERAICVSEALFTEAQQTARRAGRAGNASPLSLSAQDEWRQELSRRALATHQRNVFRALQTSAASPSSGQLWSQQVLANSLHVNPASSSPCTFVRPGRAYTLEAAATALYRERLMSTRPERFFIIGEDPEGFRALADAYRGVMAAAVAAEGRTDDPALVRAAQTVATVVRSNPALEQAYQDEFTLEFHFGEACGPASHEPGAAEASGG